jgi:hypothetical protein
MIQGEPMAGNQGTDMDYKAHEGTYSGFLGLLKWGTIVSAVAALIVVFLIS